MEEEILKVRMLGGFSMVYQEKTLVFSTKLHIKKHTASADSVPSPGKGDSEGAASGRAVWSG